MTPELKTRQDELLKLFPRAGKDLYGVIKFCPREMDSSFICPLIVKRTSCADCRRKYWLEEVKEDDQSNN